MEEKRSKAAALDAFWEQADQDGIGDNPLEVELAHRLDALTRYRRLQADAELLANDDLVADLIVQQQREEKMIGRLRDALRRMERRQHTGL